ncbi:MAG: FAD:protein FMN transferase [Chloroflexota bacterium]|nr:FAD:protein FMN transferase [Chloroflexota bacterium]
MSSAFPTTPVVEKRFRAMGTDIAVFVPPGSADAHQLAFETVAAWDARFSRFRPQSELSELNRATGLAFAASDELFGAAQTAVEAARATGGLFDPLLATRMTELGYDRTFDALPAAAEPRRLAAWVPGRWRQIVLDPERRTIRLPSGSGMDLGGLAKGMAVDAALARLVAAGLTYAAVNAGGDLAVHGLPPGFTAWPILVEGPGGRVVTLRGGALATSTTLHRRWRVGSEQLHHLIDPLTGFPSASDVVLASVAGNSCAQAEVAAKAALVAGRAAGAAFMQRRKLAGLLVAEDGSSWRIGPWSDGDEQGLR